MRKLLGFQGAQKLVTSPLPRVLVSLWGKWSAGLKQICPEASKLGSNASKSTFRDAGRGSWTMQMLRKTPGRAMCERETVRGQNKGGRLAFRAWEERGHQTLWLTRFRD